VTQKVPQLANSFLQGIPKTVDVKGLELNISLAGDPEVTPDALIVSDWGRFQNPSGGGSSSASWEGCPYRRASRAARSTAAVAGEDALPDPMITGLIDQSVANW
jgi:hypothetical protein